MEGHGGTRRKRRREIKSTYGQREREHKIRGTKNGERRTGARGREPGDRGQRTGDKSTRKIKQNIFSGVY